MGATGWLSILGVADFAGGTVVEINSGVTGLICALVLGRRLGYGQENTAPWNLSYAVIGPSFLWVGWIGFNSGSALGANARAGMAVLATQMAAAGATLPWSLAEWLLRAKPSVLGAISGAVAGLVAVTPAAGFVLPGPALGIGLLVGAICFWAVTVLKRCSTTTIASTCSACTVSAASSACSRPACSPSDPLTATTAEPAGTAIGGSVLLAVQALAIAATIAYVAAASFVLLKLTDWTVGLRVNREQEREGLDVVLHGEQVF